MDNDKAKGLMFGLAIGDALGSVACIAGGISSAYLGIAAIPDKWIKTIEKASYLEDLALRLAAAKDTTR